MGKTLKVANYLEKAYEWPLSKSNLEFLYSFEGLSDDKIAAIFNADGSQVRYYRKKYNVPKIEAWQRHDVPDKLNPEETEVILGHLLGDGHVGVSSKYPHLRVSQCMEQAEFVNQLHFLLNRWASYGPKQDSRLDSRFDKIYQTCRFDTVSHPAFNPIWELCYPNGIKTVSKNWLDQIGSMGVAIWYQGDGSLCGETLPILKTNSFSREEHDIMVSWFLEKFNIVTYCRPTTKGLNLCIRDSMRFKQIIKPYLIKEFEYKLPRERVRNSHFKHLQC